jgi:hypothetical protein
VPKKKIWANFQRIIELFTQKIVTKLSKIWLWDPGSRINLFRIPDPVVKSRVVDPYSFFTDPDPDAELDVGGQYGSGSKSGSGSGSNTDPGL